MENIRKPNAPDNPSVTFVMKQSFSMGLLIRFNRYDVPNGGGDTIAIEGTTGRFHPRRIHVMPIQTDNALQFLRGIIRQ